MQILTAAAAAAVLVLGGFVVATRGGQDDSTADQQPAAITAADEREATRAGGDHLDAGSAADDVDRRASEQADVAGDFAADEPVAAAPSETAAADSGIDAAEAPAAAVESLPVLRDADDLDVFAEAMVNDPPALDEVVADCERARSIARRRVRGRRRGHGRSCRGADS